MFSVKPLGVSQLLGRVDNILNQTPPVQVNTPSHDMAPPESALNRAINFIADLSGCGYWRMIWPENLLNAYLKMAITSTNIMLHEEVLFANVKSIRIQRQAADHQVRFAEYLRGMADKYNLNLIYEIDDIVFHEDIPMYNKFRDGFTDDKIRQNIITIMRMCHEVTTTNKFMRDYFREKTGQQNITVIPNYPPKFWMGHFYSERKIRDNFDRFRKRPRIVWAGSGAHFDVDNKIKQKDDFCHLVDFVKQTAHKYHWVFLGGYPLSIQNEVAHGYIEFHPWVKIYDYPEKLASLNANLIVAPLIDNTFNRGKSDIKLTEGSCLGIPTICQDMCTYADAILKFTDAKSLQDQIEKALQSKNHYTVLSEKHWNLGKSRFLEDHLDEYVELYSTKFGDPTRINLNRVQ